LAISSAVTVNTPSELSCHLAVLDNTPANPSSTLLSTCQAKAKSARDHRGVLLLIVKKSEGPASFPGQLPEGTAHLRQVDPATTPICSYHLRRLCELARTLRKKSGGTRRRWLRVGRTDRSAAVSHTGCRPDARGPRPPPASHQYSIDECVAAALSAAQGGTIEGMIYPDRGLAIALARGGIGAASVVRIRGFEPMPAKRYLDDYVSLAPHSW
jgi:hypothetical protein